ncbi:MAG TPA: aldehyde reductase [Acidimicrobiia bacterium]|nr:aldehyde reductase [Acidimicrobiia bacterium]
MTPLEPVTDAPVLVTGASGFIASHIIAQLFASGYRVRGTVRDPSSARHAHLRAPVGAEDRLELVTADLLEANAFDGAVKECEYVLHTASPYQIDVADPQRDLIDPAVNGTLSVLESCMRSRSVRKVVLTSSVAAITDRADGHVNTEPDWNTRSSLSRNPYYFSKTLAEQTAWSFVEKEGIEFQLVVINPFYVIGPSLGPEVNTSHGFFTGFTNGSVPAILAIEWAFVDVRDVATAHVLAMERPGAEGRYLVAAGTRTMRQVLDLLRSNGWGDRYKLPSISLDRGIGIPLSKAVAAVQARGTRDYLMTHLGGSMRFDDSKVKTELGLVFRDVDQTILETMDDLERWGHLGKK